MPPSIITEPDPEVIFDPRVNIELPCLAKGNPTPIYTWTRDGRFYEPSAQNNRVAMASDSGTLIFTQAQTIDQGWYQCNATNMWGKYKQTTRNIPFFIFLCFLRNCCIT